VCVNTLARRKDNNNDLREAIVAAHQSGKGYIAISKPFEVTSVYSEDYSQVENLENLPRSGLSCKFTSRSARAMFREIAKHPRATSQTLQASINMLNVKVHDSTVRNRLDKFSMFERVARRMPPMSFVQTRQVEMFGQNAQQRHILFNEKLNASYQHKHLIPTVKHCSGGVMIWGCFAAGHLAVIESTMNSSVYQSILESFVRDHLSGS